MTPEIAKKLKIGNIIFHEYAECEVSDAIVDYGNDNIRIKIKKNNVVHEVHIAEIFLPTRHVQEVSQMVLNEKKEFDVMTNKCPNIINPNVLSMFNKHWINMCNAESNKAYYKNYKMEFNEFTRKLFKIAKMIKKVSITNIDGIPVLKM